MSENVPLYPKDTLNDGINVGQVKYLKEKFSINNNQDYPKQSNQTKQHKILINLKNESFKKDISYPVRLSSNERNCTDYLIQSINKFAFDIYKQTSSSAFENVVISPLSLFYLFKVFYLTSTNKTEKELSKLLHLEEAKVNKDSLEKSFLVLIENLKNSINNYKDLLGFKTGSKFELNSKAYVRDVFLQENHLNMLKNTFKFDLNESTSNLISKYEKVIESHEISKNDHFSKIDLFLILENFIDFNFDWKVPFDVTIEKAVFTKSNNEKVKTELMLLKNLKFFYSKNPRGLPIRICEFPFRNENFAFTIILPEVGSFLYIESVLNFTLFNQMVEEMKLTEVNSILPKFRISERSNLIKILQNLNADSITNFDYREHGLCLDKAFYNCEINVGYNSVMGNSSTSLFLSRNSDDSKDPNLFVHSCEEFNCTNPFIFFIRDVKSKLIIQMGKLLVPTNVS